MHTKNRFNLVQIPLFYSGVRLSIRRYPAKFNRYNLEDSQVQDFEIIISTTEHSDLIAEYSCQLASEAEGKRVDV